MADDNEHGTPPDSPSPPSDDSDPDDADDANDGGDMGDMAEQTAGQVAQQGASQAVDGLSSGASPEDIASGVGVGAATTAATAAADAAGIPSEAVQATSSVAQGAVAGGAGGAASAGAGVAGAAATSAVGGALSDAGLPPEVASAGLGMGLAQQGIEAAAGALAGMASGEETLPRARYYVTITDGPDAHWQLRHLHLREALSEPYLAVLDLVTDDLAADTEALLGASCELTIHRGGVMRTVDGLIHQVEFIGVDSDRLQVRLEMVPALYLLGQRVDTRLWQNITVPDVVVEVLEAALGDYEREVDISGLTGEYEPRTYIVQYHESDLEFVSRLLEAEGISYWFDHEREEGKEILMLEDGADNYLDVETIDDNPELNIIASQKDQAEIESVQYLDWTRELTTTMVHQRTFDWMSSRPTDPLEADAGEGDTDSHGDVREVYHHGRFVEGDADPRTVRRLDHRKRRDKVARGIANVTGIYPGRKFAIVGHQRGDLDQEYLVRNVVHTADCPEVLSGSRSGGGARYECRFECSVFDPDLPPRPAPVTRIPRIYGPQTAIVTGPDSEEIHTDRHGRIKVRFDWDRIHELSQDTSMWIRVAHNWAGPGFGTFFVPRIGMEVLVEFLEGNPAQPLVVGCVYNGANGISVDLPGSKTQSTIRTCSSPGGDGYNELRFEDAAGSEQIFLHAQKDLSEVVENNHSTSVGADQSNSVSGNQTNSITKDQTESIEGKQTMTVTKTRTKEVTGDEDNTLHAKRKTLVEGDELLEVIGTTTLISGKKVTVTYKDAHSQSVGGKSDTAIDSGPAGPGDGSISAANNFELTATTKVAIGQAEASTIVLSGGNAAHATDAKFTVEATGDLTLNSTGGKLLAEGSSKLMIKQGGATVTLEGGKVAISASEITLSAGGSVIKIDGSGVAISGAKIDVAASGVTTIAGSLVKVN